MILRCSWEGGTVPSWGILQLKAGASAQRGLEGGAERRRAMSARGYFLLFLVGGIVGLVFAYVLTTCPNPWQISLTARTGG